MTTVFVVDDEGDVAVLGDAPGEMSQIDEFSILDSGVLYVEGRYDDDSRIHRMWIAPDRWVRVET